MGLIHNDLKLLNSLFDSYPTTLLTISETLVFIALSLIGFAAIFYLERIEGCKRN